MLFFCEMEWLIKYFLRSVMSFSIEVEVEKDTGDDDVVSILRVFVPYDAEKKVYKRVGTNALAQLYCRCIFYLCLSSHILHIKK